MLKNNNTILITGGTGYIGTATATELNKQGFRVVLFDINPSKALLPKQIKTEIGNICDPTRTEEVFDYYRPQCVIHLASKTSINESKTKPQLYYEVNVKGGLNILRAMDKYLCKNIIFSSSAAVYANKDGALLETDKIKPESVYGETKMKFENQLTKSNHEGKLRYVCLRYFNVSGAANPTVNLIGSPYKLMNTAMRVCFGRKKHLYIYGNSYLTRDGTAVRDYIHIKDVVSANLSALTYLLKTAKSDTINIGSGVPSTVLDVVESFSQELGYPVSVKFRPPKTKEQYSSFANINKAKSVLNWTPTQSTLRVIIKSLFWSQNLNQNTLKKK
jgi:UDP-glucose 4-epimerase